VVSGQWSELNPENPKLEIRNPKQIRNPNFQMFKTIHFRHFSPPQFVWPPLFWLFEFSSFDIVSHFDIRISNFIFCQKKHEFYY